MLNRRIIRVKALQALFARNQVATAEKLVAFDQFIEQIEILPDFYNQESEERSKTLNMLRQQAQYHFLHVVNTEPGKFPPWIDTQLNTSIISLKASLEKARKKSLSDLVKSLDDAWALFGALLAFLTEIADYVMTDEHEKRNRMLNKEISAPHQLKLAENPIVMRLKADANFQKSIASTRYKFFRDQELVRKIYRDVLCQLPQYIEYREQLTATVEEHIEILRVCMRKMLKYELLNDTLGEEDLSWEENRILIEVLAKNYFRAAKEADAFSSQYQRFQSEIDEDRDFLITLYEQSSTNAERFDDLIKKTVQNWDINRIATTDYLILHLAMTEMMYFPHIPIKVTINEYLEVSKSYSTPVSSTFLNGVLDKVSEKMQKLGLIKKSARGLMDNK
jgi:N utilization substance protein B